MSLWNWNEFTWISDDSFLWRKGEFYDCENIDIKNNVRYVTGKYEIGLPSELGSSLGQQVNKVKDWIYPAYATTNYTYIWGHDTTANAAWAYLIEQIGTTSLPVTFFFQNGAIKQVKYNGASATTVGNITTNVPSWIPTASCPWAWRIYFAVANNIYVLVTNAVDPSATICTVNATKGNNTIPFWYVIKFMYLYNDVMNIVATSNDSTYIYQLTETSTADVWAIRYTHKISGVMALGGIWENNNVFWFSNKALYQTNGTESQKIKVVWKYGWTTTFSASSIISIRDSIVYIADGTTVWEYGAIKPWYNSVLTRHTKRISVTAMDWDVIVYYTSGKVYTDRISNEDTLYDNASITSLPYEAWEFNQLKNNTAIRIGYMLPKYSTYTSTSTLANITVWILTDEMEANGVSTPVTIRTLTTPTTWVADRYADISSEEINTELADAWYSPDFQYAKIKIWLNGGDPSVVTWFWTAFFRKSPKFFGMNLVHNDIKKWIE